LPEYVLNACGVELKNFSLPAQAEQVTGNSEAEFEDDTLLESEADENADEGPTSFVPVDAALDFNAQKEAFEKEFIIKALKTFKGRINQTALHANIPKKTLLRKIEKYGIQPKDYAE
ncbi:MAG: sigma-54-dependent Fis family transcriptional regulator, partial [Bdellovibrionaceae bacterium]|nr:sigma-54-dependent Fis family transcriptional regulator [Pseudobdellovibrionaceae bacterium]